MAAEPVRTGERKNPHLSPHLFRKKMHTAGNVTAAFEMVLGSRSRTGAPGGQSARSRPSPAARAALRAARGWLDFGAVGAR